MPFASIIIPCHNHGRFIDEAVDSALAQTFRDIEIIVVDDGSTDPFTKEKLRDYRKPKTTVIRTENRGLPAARNTAIRAATGRYILPLDADDRIGPRYVEEAVAVLARRPEIGIVYSHAALFGAASGPWSLPPYSLERMVVDNVIFCSAMFRKSDWEAVGGYDERLRIGWEDYDFWLSLIERGNGVHQLPGVHFYYRIRPDSMIRSTSKKEKVAVYRTIFFKHQKLFHDHIDIWIGKMLRAHRCERELRRVKSSAAWRISERLRALAATNGALERLAAAVAGRLRRHI